MIILIYRSGVQVLLQFLNLNQEKKYICSRFALVASYVVFVIMIVDSKRSNRTDRTSIAERDTRNFFNPRIGFLSEYLALRVVTIFCSPRIAKSYWSFINTNSVVSPDTLSMTTVTIQSWINLCLSPVPSTIIVRETNFIKITRYIEPQIHLWRKH